MTVRNGRRSRLSIDVEPELHRRIKLAAASHNLSVRAYLEGILRQALALEEGLDPTSQLKWTAIPQMTVEEQQRGLQALAELEQLSSRMLEQRGGQLFSPSWELINEARDEWSRELSGEA